MTRGSRNLAILGISSIVLTIATTTVSLMLYRVSGDIYLDRSRPGYLPDKDEVVEELPSTNFVYPDFGVMDASELEQYLNELQKVNNRLHDFPDAFSASPLSDESLGIPAPDNID